MQFVDLTDIPLSMTEIAVDNSTAKYVGSLPMPQALFINGKVSYLYVTGHGNPAMSDGAKLVSYDALGNMCVYKTPDLTEPFIFGQIGVVGGGVKSSGNTIIWALSNNPAVYKWIIPNIFVPGQTFTVPYTSTALSSPCGVGAFNNLFSFPSQGLTAYEFVQAFSLSDNYFASIYNDNDELVNGGYIGNSPNDLFDRIIQSLPRYADYVLPIQGEQWIHGVQGEIGYSAQYIGWSDIELIQGGDPLICHNPPIPNTETYVTAKNNVLVNCQQSGIPQFFSNSSTILNGITDIQGMFCQSAENAMHATYLFGPLLYNKDYCVKLAYPNGNSGIPTGFSYVGKKLYVFQQAYNGRGLPTAGGTMYISDLGDMLAPFSPLPVVSRESYISLANYHRAVSPTGKFQS